MEADTFFFLSTTQDGGFRFTLFLQVFPWEFPLPNLDGTDLAMTSNNWGASPF